MRWEIEWQYLGILAAKQKCFSTLNVLEYLIVWNFQGHKSFVPSNFQPQAFPQMANPLIGWNVLVLGRNEQQPSFGAWRRTKKNMSVQSTMPHLHELTGYLFNYHWIFLESFNSSQICRFVCFPRASEPVQICGWRVVARFHGQSHPHFSGNVLRVLEEILAAARPNCGHGCNLISQNWWKNRRLKWLKPHFL